MITAHNISKNFSGIRAVHNVSLMCHERTITGLIGPNGSGKSTLVDVLTGMQKKDSGDISIVGGSGRTFQEVRVWEHMTVLENILLMTQQRGVAASLLEFRGSESKSREIVTKIGLEAYADVYAKHLSYGQRKLLEIGRTLALRAANLFYDEPFAGLFPEMVVQVKNIILDEKKKGASIVLIEHDMSVIRELCDNVVVLNAGEKIAEGEVDEVLNTPTVVEAYLGK